MNNLLGGGTPPFRSKVIRGRLRLYHVNWYPIGPLASRLAPLRPRYSDILSVFIHRVLTGSEPFILTLISTHLYIVISIAFDLDLE